MESPNTENEDIGILDQETPRAAPEDRDLMRQLLAEVAEIRKENQQLRSGMANLKTKPRRQLFQRSKDSCDPECSNAVRKVCKELSKDQQQYEDLEDQENQLKFDLSTSFDSPSNQAMAKKVVSEVRSVYGKKKWMKSAIKAAVQQHWRSMRDDKTRQTNNKFMEHRREIKRSNRLKRKLSRRLSCVETSTVLSDGDKVKARDILSSPNAVEYMSSEDSEDETAETRSGPKPRKIRTFSSMGEE